MTGPDITTVASSAAAAHGTVTLPARSPLAATVWRELLDELLRGVAHALSNRVATVSAAAYLASGGEPLEPDMAAALSAESERLERLLGDLRLLPAPLDETREPLLLADAVAQAIDLHRHHLGLRDVPVALATDATVPPVACNPVRALHLLLVMLTALRLVARDTTVIGPDGRVSVPDVQLQLSGDPEQARLTGRVDIGGRRMLAEVVALVDALAELARDSGASARHDLSVLSIEITFPSLAADRARRDD
jgi:hypothetical protein